MRDCTLHHGARLVTLLPKLFIVNLTVLAMIVGAGLCRFQQPARICSTWTTRHLYVNIVSHAAVQASSVLGPLFDEP